MNMIFGFWGAMRAMASGLLLLLGLLIAWAMVFVQMVHPQNIKMEHATEMCESAFSSVWMATLILFQTLVAGDSWGVCAMPLIKEIPLTYFFFMVSLVTVQLGFMNLVLAIIVDQAAEAREVSKEERIRRKRIADAENLEHWKTTMGELDADASGTLTEDEFMSGYDLPTVSQTLDTLHMTSNDLRQIFHLMDTDKSGTLEYEEFVDQFYKAQSQDPAVYLMCIKLQVARIQHHIEAVLGQQIDSQLRILGDGLRSMISEVVRKETLGVEKRPMSEIYDCGPCPDEEVQRRSDIGKIMRKEVIHLARLPTEDEAAKPAATEPPPVASSDVAQRCVPEVRVGIVVSQALSKEPALLAAREAKLAEEDCLPCWLPSAGFEPGGSVRSQCLAFGKMVHVKRGVTSSSPACPDVGSPPTTHQTLTTSSDAAESARMEDWLRSPACPDISSSPTTYQTLTTSADPAEVPRMVVGLRNLAAVGLEGETRSRPTFLRL